uniref:Uncharacterized protein n=1 Tax=Anguilla anguilla TaxID=7936 RepID=A0A0E9TGB9_ANGAN
MTVIVLVITTITFSILFESSMIIV